MADLPLATIRILDCTQIWAGPRAVKLLADMGAEIIKVESEKRPDPLRESPVSPAKMGPGGLPYTSSFSQLHRNQRSLSLDLTTPEGVGIFRALAKISDVVIDNFSRGVLARLGVGYEDLKRLKPDIIVISMPIFGHTGPESHYIGYGVTMEQMSGMLSLTGYPGGKPMKSGTNEGDPMNAIHAAAAVLTALYYRARTGKGQFLDFSQLESVIPLIGEYFLDYSMNKRIPPRQANRDNSMAPHGCYRCQGEDSWLAMAVSNDEEWAALCKAMGNPAWCQDEKFSDALRRWHHQEELDRHLEGWTRQQDRDEAMRLLQAAGVPAGAVLAPQELFHNPQIKERNFAPVVAFPGRGTFQYFGPVWTLSKTPGNIRLPAPRLGEHNHDVLGELLGLPPAEIARLEEKKVLSAVPAAVPGL